MDQKIYESVMTLYGWRCAECGTDVNVELHHKLPKAKWRQKKYSLFIHSPFNLVPLCGSLGNGCHEKYKHKHKITDREACVYEDFLQNLLDKK
jgi:predicted restriction endonuclease